MTIAAHKITYKRSAVEVDLTGTGAADAFSIHTVEYPYGLVPFESRSFRIYDNILTVVTDRLKGDGDVTESLSPRFLARNWSMTEPKVRIVPAELGNHAGRIGAATVALEAVRRGN